MSEKHDDVVFRIPAEFESELRQLWRDIRQASDLSPSYDLPEPEKLQRFDAVALSEWVIPLTEAAKIILPAVFGYLVARRGEVTVGEYKFKNLSATQIDEVMSVLRKHGVEN